MRDEFFSGLEEILGRREKIPSRLVEARGARSTGPKLTFTAVAAAFVAAAFSSAAPVGFGDLAFFDAKSDWLDPSEPPPQYRVPDKGAVVASESLELPGWPEVVEAVQFGDFVYRFDPPLELKVQHEDDLYILAEPSLGITVAVEHPWQIVTELSDQMAFLWRRYVQADPAKLHPRARAVQVALSDRVRRHGRS